MDGITNENQLTIVKEYKFDEPAVNKIDSIIDNCFRDCHNKFYHTFKDDCIYEIKLTKITNNEIMNISVCGKSIHQFELNKILALARQQGYRFNQITKLTKKIVIYQI